MPPKRPAPKPKAAVRVDPRSAHGGLSPKQRDFLDWLVAPIQSPRTQADWAVQNDVAQKVVTIWRNHDAIFRQAWQQRLSDEGASPENVHEVLDTMRKRAVDGDTRAADLWLKWADRINDDSTADDVKASDLSDADLAGMIESLAWEAMAARHAEIVDSLVGQLSAAGIDPVLPDVPELADS